MTTGKASWYGVPMPIQPNMIERTAFFTLNAAPGPMLDLAGMLAYQALSTAVRLDLFNALEAQPAGPAELARRLGAQERGLDRLLQALASTGYLAAANGRYTNTPMTRKWFLDSAGLDMLSAVTCFDYFSHHLWPLAPEVIRSGERPFDFYGLMDANPDLSHAFQQMMVGNALVAGPEIVRHVDVPDGPATLLDVGGGHGVFAVQFCAVHPHLRATVLDTAVALNTARLRVDEAGLQEQITLSAADLWQVSWAGPHDVILLFNLLHHYDRETNQRLLQKAHDALRPGGRVAILEQVQGSVFGAATGAIVNLVALMYYLFADGRVYAVDDLNALLSETGFAELAVHKLRQSPGTSLITAVRR